MEKFPNYSFITVEFEKEYSTLREKYASRLKDVLQDFLFYAAQTFPDVVLLVVTVFTTRDSRVDGYKKRPNKELVRVEEDAGVVNFHRILNPFPIEVLVKAFKLTYVFEWYESYYEGIYNLDEYREIPINSPGGTDEKI